MTPKPPATLTPLELEIMNLLWDHGPATVAELQPRLKNQLAYTTVMTMLSVLLRKGKVKRMQEGRAYRYTPAVTRRRAHGSALNDLVTRMFAGSDDALVMALVETRGLTSKDLDRLSRIVALAERSANPAEQLVTPAERTSITKKSNANNSREKKK